MENKLNTRQFLENFFNDSNHIKLNAIESTNGSARMLQPWLVRLEQSLASVLPYRHNQGTDWYGIAHTEQQLRELRDDLIAFVGPTWSTFRGQRAQLNLEHPGEASIHAFTGGLAFKFQGVADNSGKSREIWKALERMRRVLEHRVEKPNEVPRATGRVLRDFYMALQACDRLTAEHQLNYLQISNRLDHLNLLFLKIRMLSALEEWEELLSLAELPDLLGTRRPYEVTQALIQAVYQQELYRFEATNAVHSAVTYFHERILPQYSSLYTARANSRQPETVKSFMLLAVKQEEPDVVLQDELLNIPGLDPNDVAYLQQLANLYPRAIASTPTDIADILQQAERAGQYCDWDQVLALAPHAPPSLQKARLLFQAFYELQTLDSQREALVAFQELTSNEQETLRKTRLGKDCLKDLQGTIDSANEVPSNWIEWLEQIIQHPEWDLALDIARRAEKEWNIYDLVNEKGAIQQFRTLLAVASGKSEKTLANALPHLLSTLQNDAQYPRQELLPVYTFLLDLLAISTSGGDPDLFMFNELSNILFSLGTDQHTYQEILSYALDLWSQYSSPAKVDWILDFINITIIQPCLDDRLRSQLVFSVAPMLYQYAKRIDEIQWSLFTALIQDLNLTSAFSDLLLHQKTIEESNHQTNNFLQKLNNKSILIYTLTEPVAQRVKSMLESACKGIKVYVSHAKGGNDQLKAWISTVDLVVMVTASAKHAATAFIENRRENLPLLRVNSKGSSSLLRSIEIYLKESF